VKTSHAGLLGSCPGGQVPNTLRLFGSAPGERLTERTAGSGFGTHTPAPDLAHRPGRDAGPVSLYALTRSSGRTRSPADAWPGTASAGGL
jgi:hypothetical protein